MNNYEFLCKIFSVTVNTYQRMPINARHLSDKVGLKIKQLRLAVSKGPNRVGVSLPLPDNRKRSSFRDVVFSSYLEFWMMDKVH
jgi:hypothetical protein